MSIKEAKEYKKCNECESKELFYEPIMAEIHCTNCGHSEEVEE